MRDIDKQPYSPDEARVAKFFADRGTGGGDDPIGSILACHEYLIAQRKEMQAALEMVANDVRSGSLPTPIQNAISSALGKQ